MIAYIKGIVDDLEENAVILESQERGYRIYVPVSSLGEFKIGKEYKIHTFFSVKEDAMELYGFLDKDDLALFKLLLSVNGVGPKAAMAILSALGADTLRFAVLSDDATTIAKAPGIGKKTAAKVILELKDKISLEESFEKKLEKSQSLAEESTSNATKEAIEALTALGYSGSDALSAVKKVDNAGELTVEKLLQEALKHLAWM
ncbi:MAG TPA: Holliday junction branch migration protein RuvA [Lachnospiraceae bacterium]